MAEPSDPKSAFRAAQLKDDAMALVRSQRTTPNARAAKLAFWEWDLVSDTMSWSEDMGGLFGQQPSRAKARVDGRVAWRAAIHPADLPSVERCLAHAARDGTPIAIDHRIVLPDGSVRWIETDGDIIRDGAGKPVRIAGSCRDVTRQRQIEDESENYRQHLEVSLAERTSELDDALRSLERTAYELTEHIPVGTYTFVKRPGQRLGRYEFMSHRFIELQGLDREAIKEDIRNGLPVVHPDDAEEWARLNLEAMDEERPFRGEARHLVNGEYRWIAAEDIVRKLPDGTVIWEGVVTDVTDRRVAEQKLAESEARYRLLADNSADVIWLLDLETLKFIYVSPSVERLRGVSVDEVLRQGLKEGMAPDSSRLLEDLLPKRVAALAAGDESLRIMTHELLQLRNDGTFVPTEVTTTLLGDAGSPPKRMLGISRDITERKAIQAALDAAREREKQTEQTMRATLEKKLKTSLSAAAVAHEINQPLSRILLRARLHLERSQGDDHMLRALIDDAESVVSTINKMKALLRNVQGEQEDVDLNYVSASALQQLKAVIRASNVKVSQVEPDGGCVVRGDATQLKMVFVNLIQNAVDAINCGRRKRREIIIAQTILDDDSVEVVVGDSGAGWPGGTLDETLLNTSKPAGSGLGLYLVKTAVENHNGRIAIGRSPLGGAEFRILLPRRIA